MMDFLKKRGGYIILILLLVAAYLKLDYRYKTLKENADYHVGKIVSKGTKGSLIYEYKIDNKRYSGTVARRNISFAQVVSNYYIIIYSTQDPNVSILLLDEPVVAKTNLEKMRKEGVDVSKISFWDL